MKTVIEMAREAGFSVKNFKPPVITAQHSNGSWVGIGENLERFAELVRADERESAIRATKLYYCVVCKRQIEAVHGIFSHDDVPHPPDMTFDEERNPQ